MSPAKSGDNMTDEEFLQTIDFETASNEDKLKALNILLNMPVEEE